ncbi:NAD(P)H-binding protein [Pantoea allii]|uniref:NAD(P)H-binding protein n=1 Tax=Pantoea allii TaxID=574096 RepID=UPI0024B72881|nr:NAD(P)H-binding protein [Pantoea allii]MDJ0042917.1 NAD(P)H-binding protein [Pantoea allii]
MERPLSSGSDVRLLLLGATGLVGSHVLRQALASPHIGTVIALTRKPLALSLTDRTRLINPLIDFDAPDADDPAWRVDAVICALGTTISKAGSREAFRRVDYDYPLTFARLARTGGASAFALTSAAGANTGSRFFYNRVKGELEEALGRENFNSLTLVRPGVIAGDRAESRPGETALKLALRLLSPVLPRSWQLSPAEEIARHLLSAVKAHEPGIHIVSAGEINSETSFPCNEE